MREKQSLPERPALYLKALFEVFVLLKESSIVDDYLKSLGNNVQISSEECFIPERWQYEVQVFGRTLA